VEKPALVCAGKTFVHSLVVRSFGNVKIHIAKMRMTAYRASARGLVGARRRRPWAPGAGASMLCVYTSIYGQSDDGHMGPKLNSAATAASPTVGAADLTD
jgi:hypothetical protein